MMSEKARRTDKNQNIQVFVRLRPLNQRERDIKSLGCVEVVNNREVVVRQSQQTSLTKKFTFDRAFGPHAKQVEVYQDVVSPLIEEVLAGYNCTVFAYGQTGTGKTHTMVGEQTGDADGTTWQNDPLAGIIPRALSELFDELRLSNTEYTVRVSYLELYNEELFDLLSPSEDNSKLRIYEDVTRKGSNIVNGLEEITVYNKNEVYKIMSQGQERKRVASTLMNSQSSRSHTVFTIVVHMKENSPEGEELVKIGKLNLVDLAGSENISKAGSDNPAKKERARECVNINQSLLTLGRVITALVERHPHIPYRESKLTRILQESLGGRTKTSIIATVSPGHKDVEETMSTLEYAHRAKNIQNKPEVNQKMTKKAILKEYAEEIDRLKRDLQASRDKNGVYLASETYAEMTLQSEEQRKEIQELILHKRALEDERDKAESVFAELRTALKQRESQLNETVRRLDTTEEKLSSTSNLLETTKLNYEEQKHLVAKREETERQLSAQARALLATADVATEHVSKLHDTVDRRRNVESTNLQVTKTYRQQAAEQRALVADSVAAFVDGLTDALTNLYQSTEAHSTDNVKVLEENKFKIDELVQKLGEVVSKVKTLTEQRATNISEQMTKQRDNLHASLDRQSGGLELLLNKFLAAVEASVALADGADEKGQQSVKSFVEQWYSGSSDRLASLRSAHASFLSAWRAAECGRARAARARRGRRAGQRGRERRQLQAQLEELEQDRIALNQRITTQLSDIESERLETQARLQQWFEEEKRRLERHLEEQKAALEDRLRKKAEALEDELKRGEELFQRCVELQRSQLDLCTEEESHDEAALQEFTSGAAAAAGVVETYGTAFDQGTSAISADMEAFSHNVVDVLTHVTADLMTALRDTKQGIESGVKEAVSTEQQHIASFKRESDAVYTQQMEECGQDLQHVASVVEEASTSSQSALSSIGSASAALVPSSRAFLASQDEALQSSSQLASAFRDTLQRELEKLAELDRTYLMNEYKVYSPSGATPARQQYRFPRALAATSPHERILARYRDMPRQREQQDCIVVESDNEPSNSDTDSTLSEDSAVFAEPSPPAPAAPPTPAAPPAPPVQGVVKCTSETDIYAIRRHQQNGKENERAVQSGKKPSKLPAPSSANKPLSERNTTR
ncbi:hypothetical protein JYU34_005444 [Plutella xylostella]|uniref:Kinesin motor domain-containing protein n=1 Tax=Plutella xylostella TaxID=51655 RepID=A0ABQ7QWS8_PLUXY|nr:hypothetical protein JYU34_005444 [Plutella xylostella]